MAEALDYWWLPALVALVPAVVRLARGRALARHVDDPALAERIAAGRNLLSFAFTSCLVVLFIGWRSQSAWAIPLELVAYMAAGWPLRRVLFNETWSVGAYLSFYVRLIIAIYGFWLLLFASSWLTNLDGARGWATAAALGVALLAWNALYGRLLRALMRTRPVATPELRRRFAEVAAKSSVRDPLVEYVDLRGGVFINALALPDTRRPAVLFTSTLLERLDQDEIVGVFAHEMAHLEYFSPAYLRKFQIIGWLLIVASVTISPLVRAYAPALGFVPMLWPVVILVYMIARGRRRQQHETDSDLRAVVLTGNAEALIRGLTKLYALMKMPRRLDPNVEVHASHPSLARRIQAIRHAAGLAAAPLREAAVFTSGTKSVALHADRLSWSDGGGASFTLPYSTLDELRIDVAAGGSMRLVIADREGRRWMLPLEPHDVARAQAALDLVDTKLTAAPVGASQWPAISRLAALIAMLAVIIASQMTAFVVAALAAALPHRPLILAAGVASLTGGFVAMRNGRPAALAAFAIAAGAALLLIVWRDRRDVATRITWHLTIVIGVMALLYAMPVLLAGNDVLAIHQAARSWAGAVTLALAFAAAALLRPAAAWRSAAASAVLIAGGLTVMGSTTALDAWLDDPFLSQSVTLDERALADLPSDSFRFDLGYGDIVLSPSAAAIAVVVDDERHERSVHIGRPGQPLREFAGDHALFLDEANVLVLERGRASTTIRMIDAAAQRVVWERSLEVLGASLAVDRGGTSWQALGVTTANHPVRITGARDGAITGRREWTSPQLEEDSAEFVLWSRDQRVLVNSREYVRVGRASPALGPMSLWLLNPWRSESRLVMFENGDPRELLHTVFDVNCHAGSFIGEWPICEAYDGSRTHVSLVNPEDGAVVPIAMLQARVSLDFVRGWATGFAGGRPFAINPSTRERIVTDWRHDGEGEGPGYFVNGDTILGLAISSERASRVDLYRGFASGRAAIR
jgi:Zn-dependent protease with chaperone function